MKVYIGPYASHWTSSTFENWYLQKKYKVDPWEVDEEKFDRIDRAVVKVCDLWQDVLNATVNKFNYWRARRIKVRIDPYDTWGMDHTLALIILPMLKQLKATKHGSPCVDDEDVPEHIRSTAAKPKENEWDTDEFLHQRWDWVMDEMIWAFEHKKNDEWEELYYDNKDYEGLRKMHTRMRNGFRLFGKYYEGLWD